MAVPPAHARAAVYPSSSKDLLVAVLELSSALLPVVCLSVCLSVAMLLLQATADGNHAGSSTVGLQQSAGKQQQSAMQACSSQQVCVSYSLDPYPLRVLGRLWGVCVGGGLGSQQQQSGARGGMRGSQPAAAACMQACSSQKVRPVSALISFAVGVGWGVGGPG